LEHQVYIRRAHKAEKLVIDLSNNRIDTLIANKITAVTVLDKGTGSFTLKFIFYDGTSLTLNQDEVLNGDVFEWDINELRITNSAQSGLILKLLVDIQREGSAIVASV
jgi:hypothetical protein